MFLFFHLCGTIGIFCFTPYYLFKYLFVFLVWKVNHIVQLRLEHNLKLEKVDLHNLIHSLNHIHLICLNHLCFIYLNLIISHLLHLDIFPSHPIKRIHNFIKTYKQERIPCMVMLATHITWKLFMMTLP